MKTKKRLLGKMTALSLFGAMLLLFTACPRSKPTYVDLGSIPEQYLATVPYQDGDVFRMQHEASKVIIEFEVSRYRNKETGFDYVYRHKPAPNYYYDYEVDRTICKPKYPIFDVDISFSNQYMAYEEEEAQAWNKVATLYVAGGTYIPLFGEDCSNYEVLDSLDINGRYFHNVFKLKTDYYYEDEEMIHAETVFYNYEKGLLGIMMSNGEKYWLYED